jgi:hypothetical protein
VGRAGHVRADPDATQRDIQRGLLLGVSLRRPEAAVCIFNPGSDDRIAVVSLGVPF